MTSAALPALPTLVEDFLVAAEAKGLRQKSLDAYAVPLRRIFLPWCKEKGLEGPEQLDRAALDRFSITVNQRTKPNGQRISPNSARTYLKAVNQFLSWLRLERGFEGKGNPLPKKRKMVIDPLSEGEIQRLEDAATAERDKLIILLMAATGAREGEVANLRTTDLILRDRRQPHLQLRGKTGERLVPLTDPDLVRRLQAYIRNGRRGAATDAMFVNLRLRVEGGELTGLTGVGIYRMVKALAAQAKMSKRVYPHLFRHTAITRMVRDQLNPILISDVTGVSLQVIQETYSHLSHEDHWRAMSEAQRRRAEVRSELR